MSVSLSPRPLPVGGGRSCGGETGKGVTACVRPPGRGVGAIRIRGGALGGDPGLRGHGLAGSAPPGHDWSCLRPRMGWEGGRSHREPARVAPAARFGAGSPRPQSATLPRSCGCQVSGGVQATQACPRPEPPRSLKAGAAPESCAGRSRTQLLYSASLGVGDSVGWRYPLLSARPGSPPGQLGFRRS